MAPKPWKSSIVVAVVVDKVDIEGVGKMARIADTGAVWKRGLRVDCC